MVNTLSAAYHADQPTDAIVESELTKFRSQLRTSIEILTTLANQLESINARLMGPTPQPQETPNSSVVEVEPVIPSLWTELGRLNRIADRLTNEVSITARL